MKTEPRFTAGDIVQLKSGGPKMVVEVVSFICNKTSIYCLWFDAENKKCASHFYPETLEHLVK